MQGMDSVYGAFETEQVRVSMDGEPDVWFRRRIGLQKDGVETEAEARAEVITDNPDVAAVLKDLAERYPADAEILSGAEDGRFHAILSGNITIHLLPPKGSLAFIVKGD